MVSKRKAQQLVDRYVDEHPNATEAEVNEFLAGYGVQAVRKVEVIYQATVESHKVRSALPEIAAEGRVTDPDEDLAHLRCEVGNSSRGVRDLAREVGISHVSLHQFINGGRLKYETAKKLFRACGYDLRITKLDVPAAPKQDVNLAELIRQYRAEHPESTSREVSQGLRDRGVATDSSYVSQVLKRTEGK